MAERALKCRRCVVITKNANQNSKSIERAKERHRQIAERDLTKIRDKANRDGWRLPRLQQAIDSLRKKIPVPLEDWDPIIRSVFGVPPGAIVDPRQIPLFADASNGVRKTA